ncbi:hypothetical protein C2W64_00106 [Brevibacillus laterosporus]|nr:hypothetical protein C2W64_00106 [Brevibacillus laterosporus]
MNPLGEVVGTLLVLILAGAAVSIVGAVGFVGLIISHLTRFLVGVEVGGDGYCQRMDRIV